MSKIENPPIIKESEFLDTLINPPKEDIKGLKFRPYEAKYWEAKVS